MESSVFKNPKFIIYFIIGLILSFFINFLGYYQNLNSEKEKLQDKLYLSALSLKYVLPENYHDRIHSQESISQEEYKEVNNKLNRMVNDLKVDALYSLIEKEGKLFLTSSNIKSLDRLKGSSNQFFSERKDFKDIIEDSANQQFPLYIEHSDSFGNYYSIIIKDSNWGKKKVYYIADITDEKIQIKRLKYLNISIFAGCVNAIIVLCLLLDYFYFHHIKEFLKYKFSKIIIITILILFFPLVFFAGKKYYDYKILTFQKTLDEDLITSAYTLKYILPSNYQDRAANAAVSSEEYWNTVKKLNEFVNQTKVKYIYSMIENEGKVKFTTSNYKKEDVEKKVVTEFLEVYDAKVKRFLENIKKDRTFFYWELGTKWGDLRTAVVPARTLNNLKYFLAADIEIQDIKLLYKKFLYISIFYTIILLIYAFPFAIFMIAYLIFFYKAIRQGDLFVSIKVKLVIYVGGTAFLCFYGISFIFGKYSEELLQSKTIETCRNLAFNIANIAREDLILDGTFDSTKTSIDDIFLSGTTALNDIYILDVYGKYVVDYKGQKIGQYALDEEIQYAREIQDIDLKIATDERELHTILKISYPIFTILDYKKIKIGVAIFEYNRDLLYQPIYEIENKMNWIGIILLILTLFVTLFISVRTTHPIVELTKGVSIISSGELDYKIEVETKDEIGILSKKFNEMTLKIKDYTNNLEHMVQERTEEVMRSRETLQNVLSYSPLILFLLGREGNIIFAEGKGLDRFGITGNQAIGFTLFELFSEMNLIKNEFLLSISDNKQIKTEIGIEGVDFEINFSPLKDQKNEIINIIGLFIDITERKIAEREMKERLFYEEQLSIFSEKLLEDKDETIDEALEIIRKLSDVDRIVLVKNFKSKKNKLYMKVQSEITSPIIEKRKVANISYSGSFNLIREALQKGKEIHWTLDSSPKKINKLLQKLNIKSLLFIPVFIKGKWEGFLSFEDSVFRKNWNDSDIQLIQTIARMIGTKLEIEQAQNEIKVEKEKSDNLLLNILPSKIAEELKEKGEVKPTSYNSASILFTDFKGFTRIAARKSPEKLLDDLNVIFLQFDQICERRQVEKLKTIGDSFMCAGGLPVENNSHPIDICLAALEMNSFLRDAKAIVENITGEEFWDMRIGIHTGSVVAGVVGKSKFAYDIWGDAVNIASRMESSCEVGKINISVDTYNLVKDFFNCDYRGKIEAKNRGEIEMYFLYGIKLELSKNREGLVPSDEFFELMRQKGMI